MTRLKVQVWIHRGREGRREFLILLLKPERGGFWQPVTGGVEPDETLEEAAAREAREETGLEYIGAAKPIGREFEFERGGMVFRETGFALEASPVSEPRLDGREHVDFRWVSFEEAMRALHHRSNAEMLEALQEKFPTK